MKTNKNLWVVAAGLVVCVVVVWFSTSIHGRERTYEVRPEIAIPEYRTDTARAIDAYERLMERYMDMTECWRNLTGIGMDVKNVAKKLDSIDVKLTDLCTRITRIEKALSIRKSQRSARQSLGLLTEKTCPVKTQEKSDKPACERAQQESSPPM